MFIPYMVWRVGGEVNHMLSSYVDNNQLELQTKCGG